MTAADQRFSISAWVFLRGLAVVHLIAFASFWSQAGGLVGPHGIVPASQLFSAVQAHFGPSAWWRIPSVCWWTGAGSALGWLSAAGVALSVLLFAGVAPGICLVLLWADYLSLIDAGWMFFDYQWDALLLETTLLAIFLAPWSLWPGWSRPEPPRLARWGLWWLLFRLLFVSGVVKLASGDPTWRNLTALAYHFETQPLPTPLAWYADHLPLRLLEGICAALFLIELVAPFTLFSTRELRHVGAVAAIVLQGLIALTGNYAYFNGLTILLCVMALDDAAWGRWGERLPGARATAPPDPAWKRWPVAIAAVAITGFTAFEAMADFIPEAAIQPWVVATIAVAEPFRSLNNYGLFARMTTQRPTLVIEGSDDASTWKEYELPHQAGDVRRRPTFIAPFQPRLDWQLWFAALETPSANRWVQVLCQHLLRGTPEVLALFEGNPFAARPPRFVRVLRYNYRFTTRAERAATGAWWHRTLWDTYVAPVSLTPPTK